MWPDLGKYEVTVLSAYGAGLALIAVLVLATALRAASVRRELRRAEDRRRQAHG